MQIYQAVHKLSWWFDVEFGKIMDNWKLNNRTVAVPKRMRASNGGSSRYNVATALVSNRFAIDLCPAFNDRTETLCHIIETRE